jgi:hypothetical protein
MGIASVGSVSCGAQIASENYDADLTVCQLSYGKVSVAAVLDGSAAVTSISASADGRGFNSGAWHEGAEAEAVYVEKIDGMTGAVTFHGWVDGVSRQLVQAG